MLTARIRRLLRELQTDPITHWFCVLLGVGEPQEISGVSGEEPGEATLPLA